MAPNPKATIRIQNRIDQYRVYGLVAFNLTLPEIDEAVRLRIQVGRSSREFAPSELRLPFPDADPLALRFCLVTQLLDNGPDRIIVTRLRQSDGSIDEQIISAYDILVDNVGTLSARVRVSLEAAGAPAITGAVIDSKLWPYGKLEPRPWFDAVEPDANVPLATVPPATTEQALAHLHRWGFTLLPVTYPAELCDALNKAVDEQIEAGKIKYEWGASTRLHNVHRLPEGRHIWCYPPVMNFLRRWFEDDPVACQTLYYVFGSQQSAHQDTIHLTPFPSGYMCGVWVSLQDVQPDSGELFVHPGSHVVDRLRGEDLGLPKVQSDYSTFKVFDDEVKRLMAVNSFDRLKYLPKKGHILVWHENLSHGGSQRIDTSLPRRSIVSHYFARGSIAYYDARGEAAALEEPK